MHPSQYDGPPVPTATAFFESLASGFLMVFEITSGAKPYQVVCCEISLIKRRKKHVPSVEMLTVINLNINGKNNKIYIYIYYTVCYCHVANANIHSCHSPQPIPKDLKTGKRFQEVQHRWKINIRKGRDKYPAFAFFLSFPQCQFWDVSCDVFVSYLRFV